MEKHIALKCNWNDGTQKADSKFPGWSGVCSSPLMKLNVVGPTRRTWCSNKTCACARAITGPGRLPRGTDKPCYESSLFTNLSFSAGGRRIRQTGPGKLAFLTSRRPFTVEDERVIIGAYRIREIGEHPHFRGQDSVVGVKSSMVRLLETQFLPYWDLVSRPEGGKPAWDTGLTRFLDDADAASILRAIEAVGLDISALDKDAIASTRNTRNAKRRLPSDRASEPADTYRDKVLNAERAFFLRNSKAAQDLRRVAKGVCEGCGINSSKRYGTDIIEAHHRRAFAEMPPHSQIVLADLAALCPSCHRALHRLSPSTTMLLSVKEFAMQVGKRGA